MIMTWKFHATIAITSAPRPTPMAVPRGPAMGRNSVHGMTKESQPTAQPKASDQAAMEA